MTAAQSLARGTAGNPAVPVTGVGPNTSPAPQPLVVGLDLSLTCCGIATATPQETKTFTVKGQGHGVVRLRQLVTTVAGHCLNASLVVVEGPSYGSIGPGQHERGGLWWMVADRLWEHNLPVAVAPPTNIKKYATGRGNASKDLVLLAAARRFPDFTGGNDEADALFAAVMGLDHLTGQSVVPASHRAALAGCAWPTVARTS